MVIRSRRATSLLALNWLLFLAVYAWISVAQGNLLWWLRLSWGSWLSDFGALAVLGPVPSGSMWILWLMLSIAITAIYLPSPARRDRPAEAPAAPEARRQLVPNADLMDARPELKEKILRLHQSLEKI